MCIVMFINNDDFVGVCCLFDRDCDGFVFGEGGVFLLIEIEEYVKVCGVNILVWIMGVSIIFDGFYMVVLDFNGECVGYVIMWVI